MRSYGKKLRLVYIGALSCIAVLSIASHLYLSSTELTLANDAPVVNVSGTQRVLAQRIASLGQQLYLDMSRGDFEIAAEKAQDLTAAASDMQIGHRALVNRRGELGLEGLNPFEIAKDLVVLNAPVERIVEAAERLTDAVSNPADFDGETVVEAVDELIVLSDRFAESMESIANAYEADATRKLDRLKTIENLRTGLALVLLAFLAYAVFEPAIRTLTRQESDLLALRRAIDSHTVFSVTDRRGRIIEVNDGFCEISGYSREELVGATHKLISSGHHPDSFWDDMWQTIIRGDTWRSEVCNRAKDGSLYWVDSTNIPQFDSKGEIERFISLRFDITQKKRAEAARRAAHAELQSILNAAQRTAITAANAEGRITMFSAGAERMLGYSAEEAMGQRSFELYMLESEIIERIEERSKELGRPVDGSDAMAWNAKRGGYDERRWTYVCKDGRHITVNAIITATFDAEGEVTGYVCVSEDITEKLESERRLEAQRAEQRAIIDAIPSSVWYKDSDLRILDCNISAIRSSGLRREDIIGKLTQDLVSPGDVDNVVRADKLALESVRPTLGRIEKFESSNGETRYLRMDKTPLRNEAGEVDRLVVISTDISDVVRANDQLREAEERLDMALSASSTGLWDWNLEDDSTHFNHVVFEIIGYRPGELDMSMLTWRDLCHPKDLSRVQQAIDDHIAGKTETYSCEYRVRRRDDAYVWIRDVGQIVDRDDAGKPRRIVGVYIDIQELRDALGEAERSHGELERSQQRFELAIEGSRDAIFDWNLATDEVWFSPRWLQLLKVSEGALGSTIPGLLWHVVPEDADRLNRELAQFVESREERFDSEFQLVDGNDEPVWVMMRAVAFRDAAGKATRVAGSVADITSLKEAQAAMERLVQQDHLTGLASRTRLAERLEHAVKRARRNSSQCGVLFFDFDRFKVVNDSLGHDVGDELLCSIADRLRENVRETDTPARFGGDEFVILLEDLAQASDAMLVADKLLGVCAAPHQIRGHSLVSTASIGLVTSGYEGATASDLLRYADAAMYEAKRNGRACIVEFDKAMFDAQQRSAELEEELQSAIARNELELHYQPVIDLQTGGIVSVEALLRWNHSTKGTIPPGQFISIAEESRQIVAIGEWVIMEACRQLVDWRERGIAENDFAVSVNASKVQLLTPGFEKMLVGHVDDYGLPRNALKVEVTETTIVDNRSDIGDVLRSLRDQSIIIMMDDFGTGHSSLSVLHNLPVDELKIDQSFIRHADKNRELVAITSSILTLAEHLSLKTIGEGIEAQEHVALLQSLGCTYGQGYFWSKPVPAAEFEKLLSERPDIRASRSA